MGKLLGAWKAVFRDGDGAADFDDDLIDEGWDFASGDGGDGCVDGVGVDDASDVGSTTVDTEVEGGLGGGRQFFFNGFADHVYDGQTVGAEVVEVCASCGDEDEVVGVVAQPEADVAAGAGNEARPDEGTADVRYGLALGLPALGSHGVGPGDDGMALMVGILFSPVG